MPGRRPLVASLLLLGSLAVGLLVAAPVAQAQTILMWNLDQRPAGPPATTEPARTLASAYADLGIGRDESAFHATVELGAVPTAETAADLHLRIGTVEDGACRPDWELVVPTLTPSGPATRDGATIRVGVTTPGPDGDGVRCASATLVDAQGGMLDELVDAESRTAIADPGAQAHVERVTGTRVRPGHWSTVWVRVAHTGADADGVRVTGEGPGLRVRAHTVRLTLHEGDEVWVPLRVWLRGERVRRLTISAVPFGGELVFTFAGTRTVLVRPGR